MHATGCGTWKAESMIGADLVACTISKLLIRSLRAGSRGSHTLVAVTLHACWGRTRSARTWLERDVSATVTDSDRVGFGSASYETSAPIF
jgi:hypothetical protein